MISPDQGSVFLSGKQVHIFDPSSFISEGVSHIPEDRNLQGLVGDMSIADNLVLKETGNPEFSNGIFLKQGVINTYAQELIRKYDIRCQGYDQDVRSLSGGNQQKVILARWMSTKVDIIIFDEPTKGVDVGAKAEIYRLMEEMIQNGKSIIVISSELPEVMGLSDRIVVMGEGRVNKVLNRNEFGTSDQMLDYAIGGNE